VLALCGPLGSGKTVLCQGLARGMGAAEGILVTSPSFVIIHEYPGPRPLFHFDFYRLARVEDVWALGYEEYFEGEGVCAVEWAEKFPELFGPETLWVRFSRVSEFERRLEFKPGRELRARWPAWQEALENIVDRPSSE